MNLQFIIITKKLEVNNKMAKPINKFQAGNIDTAIWNNEIEIDGKKINTKSISLRKSWKSGEEWKDATINLQANEIQKAILVL